uniref:IF rod domain-containing protein n=1 Tax=Otolemur garnettii TaxID=30611 RepID=H0XNW6_OTOGA
PESCPIAFLLGQHELHHSLHHLHHQLPVPGLCLGIQSQCPTCQQSSQHLCRCQRLWPSSHQLLRQLEIRGLGGDVGQGLAGMGSIWKFNDNLASYLDVVRKLETNNWRLESKLWNKGPQDQDWVLYFKTVKDVKAQIFENPMDNAHMFLQVDNAVLAADNFGVEYEKKLTRCQSVETDIRGLHKVIDDNVTQLKQETDIKEKLFFMKKNHQEEVKGL